ncbi:unnamed protein product [Gongylonema pulchrum]|uniref:Tetratricopeptide repeat protein 30 n=1 Tax=Gongylonema pulchrum TaxID=637853 RepID=A0A183EI78_9BILA|nr:unnamed protein product [Gongylonema pulchrum]
MPPRSEEELDPVTLHNQALISMDTAPSDGFAKLQYLLSQNPFPPETFSNLLLLYCKYEVHLCAENIYYYDLAADVLAENAHLTYKYLTQYLYDYLDAIITQVTSPMDAFNKFEAIANEQVNELRKLTKLIHAALFHLLAKKEVLKGSSTNSRKFAKEATNKRLENLLKHTMIRWPSKSYEDQPGSQHLDHQHVSVGTAHIRFEAFQH